MSKKYQEDIEEEIAAEEYFTKLKDNPTERKCLSCNNKFIGNNKYYRVCKKCKTSFTYYLEEDHKIVL